MAKVYDVVVFGATSFVGQILCEYLVQAPEEASGVRWAMAGRSEEKLQDLKKSLGLKAVDIPIILADAGDEASLQALCEQTRVVISTVGPYALYGEPMVKACVETGTDYCDLTGEAQWIRRMMDKYEAQARESGARMVHCCGFDSIPSDLGVFYLQTEAEKRFGERCDQVRMRVRAAKGGFSGGTVASIVNAVKEAMANPQVRKIMADPYALCPPNHPFSVRQKNQKKAEFDDWFNAWTAPFVMAAINTRVVFRTNALLGNRYGVNFRYDEAVLTGKGLKGRASATGMATGLALFVAGTVIKPARWVLERFFLPKPGEGPSPEAQENGYYDLRFIGQTPHGKRIKAKVTGDRDPGYGSTAKMLAQAGITLATEVPDTDAPGGFWTPASVLGEKLIQRLERYAGLTFDILD